MTGRSARPAGPAPSTFPLAAPRPRPERRRGGNRDEGPAVAAKSRRGPRRAGGDGARNSRDARHGDRDTDRVTILLGGIVGSTAYGLAGPHSDIDRLGVFAAPTEEFHGLRPTIGRSATVTRSNPDVTVHEARKFASLALAANPTVSETAVAAGHPRPAGEARQAPASPAGPGPRAVRHRAAADPPGRSGAVPGVRAAGGRRSRGGAAGTGGGAGDVRLGAFAASGTSRRGDRAAVAAEGAARPVVRSRRGRAARPCAGTRVIKLTGWSGAARKCGTMPG